MDQVRKCRGCGRDLVLLRTTKGHWEPVDPETVQEWEWKELEVAAYGRGPVFDPDVHRSHFATCPNADEYRRPSSRPTRRALAEKATPSLFGELG